MGYCLWLNGIKINSVEQIADNFDIDSLKSYYYGGSLLKWLRSHKGEEIAGVLESLPADSDIESGLKYAFGLIDEIEAQVFPLASEKLCALPTKENTELSADTNQNSIAGSFPLCSFSQKGFFGGSFDISSFPVSFFSSSFLSVSSYTLDSFRSWEALFLTSFPFYESFWGFDVGSFSLSSFSFGSYSWEAFLFGSYHLENLFWGSFFRESFPWFGFSLGSFFFGSYRLGSFPFGSYIPGYYDLSSFIHNAPALWGALCMDKEEAVKLIFHINSCPLNRYGYGINLI